MAADCQFWMIVHACLLHLSVSWLADNVRAPNGGKRLAAACHSVALLFMLRTAYVLTARDGRDSSKRASPSPSPPPAAGDET